MQTKVYVGTAVPLLLGAAERRPSKPGSVGLATLQEKKGNGANPV